MRQRSRIFGRDCHPVTGHAVKRAAVAALIAAVLAIAVGRTVSWWIINHDDHGGILL